MLETCDYIHADICNQLNETEPLHWLRHRRSYQVEMIWMWKRGLQANPLIINLDRSLMARGSQEDIDLFPPPLL